MSYIDMCIIGRRTPDFTAHLTIIRKINGLKVMKRRNKPFYDITGNVSKQEDIAAMAEAIKYLLNNCEAELDIKDEHLRQVVFDMIK